MDSHQPRANTAVLLSMIMIVFNSEDAPVSGGGGDALHLTQHGSSVRNRRLASKLTFVSASPPGLLLSNGDCAT